MDSILESRYSGVQGAIAAAAVFEHDNGVISSHERGFDQHYQCNALVPTAMIPRRLDTCICQSTRTKILTSP